MGVLPTFAGLYQYLHSNGDDPGITALSRVRLPVEWFLRVSWVSLLQSLDLRRNIYRIRPNGSRVASLFFGVRGGKKCEKLIFEVPCRGHPEFQSSQDQFSTVSVRFVPLSFRDLTFPYPGPEIPKITRPVKTRFGWKGTTFALRITRGAGRARNRATGIEDDRPPCHPPPPRVSRPPKSVYHVL